MAKHINLGKRGEDIAVEYLSGKGYAIVERNWRNSHKEVDVIARDGDTLVIVEVKTRRTDLYGFPDEAVSERKQKLLVDAANAYIEKCDLDCDTRFDIVSVVLHDNGKADVEHIENAFEC